MWGVAKGAGFSCQEHLHLTGFGDLELVGLGAGFCLNKLEDEDTGDTVKYKIVGDGERFILNHQSATDLGR